MKQEFWWLDARWSELLVVCEVANSLTAVGLTRVSIGPAIRVMLSGSAGLRSSAIKATAARV